MKSLECRCGSAADGAFVLVVEPDPDDPRMQDVVLPRCSSCAPETRAAFGAPFRRSRGSSYKDLVEISLDEAVVRLVMGP